MFDFLKKYQGGGNISPEYGMQTQGEYGSIGSGQDFLHQQLLQILQGYNIDIDPSKSFMSQMEGVGQDFWEKQLRSKFNIPGKVQTNKEMFTPLHKQRFASLFSDFYHPIYHTT